MRSRDFHSFINLMTKNVFAMKSRGKSCDSCNDPTLAPRTVKAVDKTEKRRSYSSAKKGFNLLYCHEQRANQNHEHNGDTVITSANPIRWP